MKVRAIAMTLTASFSRRTPESDSSWVLGLPGGTIEVSIGDLFPDGEYDISSVGSKRFGLALIDRLNVENVSEALSSLVNSREAIPISSGEEFPYKSGAPELLDVVCNFVPLNSQEQKMRDEVRGTAIQEGGV